MKPSEIIAKLYKEEIENRNKIEQIDREIRFEYPPIIQAIMNYLDEQAPHECCEMHKDIWIRAKRNAQQLAKGLKLIVVCSVCNKEKTFEGEK